MAASSPFKYVFYVIATRAPSYSKITVKRLLLQMPQDLHMVPFQQAKIEAKSNSWVVVVVTPF